LEYRPLAAGPTGADQGLVEVSHPRGSQTEGAGAFADVIDEFGQALES